MNDESKKQATFPVWDQETGEIIEMTMDEDDYFAMIEYEDKLEIERQERRIRLQVEEHRLMMYDRDD